MAYQDSLAALLAEPTFVALATMRIAAKARIIKDQGNRAVHTQKVITQYDALTACRELFQFAHWLAHRYARGARPAPELSFNDTLLPKTSPVPPQTQKKLEELAASLAAKDESLAELLKDETALNRDIQRLGAEVAAAKSANEAAPTPRLQRKGIRDAFIDLLLKEAGWGARPGAGSRVSRTGDAEQHRRRLCGLCAAPCKPLAVVETKRTKRGPEEGHQQAKLYADCLEKQFGQRPLIFYSNGYDHWMWDDQMYPRVVRASTPGMSWNSPSTAGPARKPLETGVRLGPSSGGTTSRERFEGREAFENDQRKALLVMATGAGKTRTVIALSDLFMRCKLGQARPVSR